MFSQNKPIVKEEKSNQREIKSLFTVVPILESVAAEYLSHSLAVHSVWW